MTTERPIIFSAPMVRALLAGAKTQTRRVVKPQPTLFLDGVRVRQEHGIPIPGPACMASGGVQRIKCPYGLLGDRLWVRETWQGPLFDYDQFDAYRRDHSRFEKPEFCAYAADGGPAPEFVDEDDTLQCRWRPPIYMPRWASRITLEITRVRVERLQDISAKDAMEEGIMHSTLNDPRVEYQWQWESIHGDGSWAANPWVWVVEFQRVAP